MANLLPPFLVWFVHKFAEDSLEIVKNLQLIHSNRLIHELYSEPSFPAPQGPAVSVKSYLNWFWVSYEFHPILRLHTIFPFLTPHSTPNYFQARYPTFWLSRPQAPEFLYATFFLCAFFFFFNAQSLPARRKFTGGQRWLDALIGTRFLQTGMSKQKLNLHN